MKISNSNYTQFQSMITEGADELVRFHQMQVHNYETSLKWLEQEKKKRKDNRDTYERLKQYVDVSAGSFQPYDALEFHWSQSDKVLGQIADAFGKMEQLQTAPEIVCQINRLSAQLENFRKYYRTVRNYLLQFNGIRQHILEYDGIEVWSKKAARLVKTGFLTEKKDLMSYSEEAVDNILSAGLNLFSGAQTRYAAANLYAALMESESQLQCVQKLMEALSFYNHKGMISEWLTLLLQDDAALAESVKKMEEDAAAKKAGIEPFMKKKIQECIDKLADGFPVKEWNDTARGWNESSKRIAREMKHYIGEDVMQESYLCGWQQFVIGRESGDPYVQQYYQRIIEIYHELVTAQQNKIIIRVPVLMTLDQNKWNFVLELGKDDDVNRKVIEEWCRFFIASSLVNIPVGKAEFHFIDPGNTGIFSIYRDIGKGDDFGNVSQKCHYFSSEEQITSHLVSVSEEISYIINQILKGGDSTLYRHNKENTYNMRPYHFLFLHDYPKGLSRRALEQLENIVVNGPKCGIFTIIFNTKGNAWELLNENELIIAKSLLANVYTIKNGLIKDRLLKPLIYDKFEDYEQLIGEFSIQYNRRLKEEGHLKIRIDDLSGEVHEQGGFKIPIGLNQGGGVEYLSFFDQCQNYLMSGATGSGKSNAMHVMIYTALKYIKNLDLYLIDFKHGVEFAPYARLNHPSFKLLAVESVPEFGLAVLRHIKNKIDEIGKLFTQTGVENWWNYRNKTGKTLPVTLVMIDEFQHLFDGAQCEECAGIVEYIAKEGRVFNAHLILATQSISTVRGLTDGAKENIFGRLALFHNESEYKSMFWGDSKLASTLKDDAKGLAVLATAPDNKRIIQIAVKKEFEEVRRELGYDPEEGRFETRLLLSSAQDKPFSIFNAFLEDHYECGDRCGLAFGDMIDLKKSDIRLRMKNDSQPKKIMNYQDECTLYFGDSEDENLLIVGNHEDMALNIFTLSLYSVLIRQAALGRKESIAVFLPEEEDILMDICNEHNGYIRYFTQDDDLAEAFRNEDLEYLFVYGLQNFKSLSFQMAGAGLLRKSDGTAFRRFLEAQESHAIVWCDRVSLLESMYGDGENLNALLDMFVHKVGMKLDKSESEKYIGSDACALLSTDSILYRRHNSEKTIRPYKGFDSDYSRLLDHKIEDTGFWEV